MKRFYGIPLIMAFAVSPLMAWGTGMAYTPSQEVCENIQHGEWIIYNNEYFCEDSSEACLNTEGGENRQFGDNSVWSYLYTYIDVNGDQQDYLATSCKSEEFCNYIGYDWDSVTKDCVKRQSQNNNSSSGGSGSGNSGTETGGGSESGSGSGSSSSSGTRFRVNQATHEASATTVTSGQYVKGAYNANVGNINTALTYVENSAVETINNATVSANNLTLSVNGFTPSGTVSMDSTKATITGTVNVPTTVPALDTWGSTSTTNATLGGTAPTNINSGATLSGVTASFTGTASGNLTGSGSFNNAKVSVDDWYPVNPQ